MISSNSEKLTNEQIKALTEIWGELEERNAVRIIGNSMCPLINAGNILIIEHNIKEIKRGEIVVFRSHHSMVAHRVVKALKGEDGKEYYLTKGDHNRYFDITLLTKMMILGKVIKVSNSSKIVDYDTLLWKNINYIIAIISYLLGKLYMKYKKAI